MSSFRSLLLPSRLEAFFWFVAGFGFLLFTNISKLWQYLSGESVASLTEQSSIITSFSAWLLDQEAKLDPRIIDFLVWMLVGILAVGAVLIVQGWFHAAGKELTLLEYMRSPNGRVHEVHAVVLRFGLRSVGIVGLLVGFWLYFGVVATEIEHLFFTSMVNLDEWQSWLWLVLCPAITGLSLYILSIFGRLIVLRKNIFD